MSTTQERFAKQHLLRHRRRWHVIKALLLLIGAVFLIRWAILSPWLAFAHANINGAQTVERADILNIAGLQEPFNLMAADPDTIASRLTGDLRIESAVVVRSFPATLTINIRERRTVAYVRHKLGFVKLDGQGVILTIGKVVRDAKAPMISGTVLSEGYIGDAVPADSPVARVTAFLGQLDPWTAGQLSEIQLAADGTAQAITLQGVPLKLGNTAQLAEKTGLTDTVVRQIVPISHQVSVADLTFSRPYITVKK